jgi:alanine racemase
MDPWVELNAGHLRHNVAEVHRRVEGRPIIAVIKNNGYGGGLIEVARVLDPLPEITQLSVVRLHEAVCMRDAGLRKPILLIGPLAEDEVEDAVRLGIRPGVYTEVGERLEQVARKLGTPVPVHVSVDTGLGREGVPVSRASALVKDLAGRPGVKIEGIMTTFAETDGVENEQLERFRDLCDGLKRDKIDFGWQHIATSSTLYRHPDAFFDAVRPGFVFFGVHDEPAHRDAKVMSLRPTHALRARVIYVKQLAQGDTVGYGSKYRAPGPVWVATLPLGHADGYPRAAVKGGTVLINGRKCPVIGSVSASSCVAELGPERTAEVGDVATFFDWTEGSRPDEFAWSCDASPYDVIMHINPLLPRQVV